MKTIEIEIIKGGQREVATLIVDRRTRKLTFIMNNGTTNSCTAEDLYVCFGLIRAQYPDIVFLCKGAKINVHPSRMTSQMSTGLVAYELTNGQPTEESDIVRIFDYEDNNLTNNLEIQKAFYFRWIKSLKT
jgi:hypothetical protein